MADARLTRASAWLCVVLAVGCAARGASDPETAAVKARPAPPLPVEAPDGLPDRDWTRLVSTRFMIELPLPDARAWRVESTPDWFVARHAPSQSELRVATFRAERVSNRADCEALGRQSRIGIPEVLAHAQIHEELLNVPDGFDTTVLLGVEPESDGALRGIALAVGANVRRCLLMVFETRVTGPDPERRLVSRLEIVASRVFGKVRTRGVDARAGRDVFEMEGRP